jgi:hypothetical protein
VHYASGGPRGENSAAFERRFLCRPTALVDDGALLLDGS